MIPAAVTTRSSAALLAALTALALSGCRPAGPPAPPHGPVGIGDDRTVFLDCQGDGSPTVLIIPGKGSYAEAWNVVVPQDDPIRSSTYDIIERAALTPSPEAVQPTVARTTRVCAYDRPNTRPDGADQSTPVPQPHSVAADVDDLLALIAAAHLDGPFVLVAHSYGALVADLLARTHPDLVNGLVMVDPVSEFLPAVGNSLQNAAFDRDGRVPATPDGEGVLFDDAFSRIETAPPLPNVPAAVLSSGKFMPPERLKTDNYTQAQIHRANDMLAAALGTDDRVVADSGHNVMLYSPRVVADVIDAIVEAQ